jgi:hypothetical protein
VSQYQKRYVTGAAQRCPETYAPKHSLLAGSMYGVRIGEEGPHRVTPQDALLFTLTRATLTLNENVFPDFLESEQGPDYE